MIKPLSLFLSLNIFLCGCKNLQIGSAKVLKEKSKNFTYFPIRQVKIYTKGYCLKSSRDAKYCLLNAEKNICLFYVDIDRDGEYTWKYDLPDKRFRDCIYNRKIPRGLHFSEKTIQSKKKSFEKRRFKIKFKKIEKQKKVPILELLLYEKGRCLNRNKEGHCLIMAKEDICLSYIDTHDDGKYDWKHDPLSQETSLCSNLQYKHLMVYPLKETSYELKITQ